MLSNFGYIIAIIFPLQLFNFKSFWSAIEISKITQRNPISTFLNNSIFYNLTLVTIRKSMSAQH